MKVQKKCSRHSGITFFVVDFFFSKVIPFEILINISNKNMVHLIFKFNSRTSCVLIYMHGMRQFKHTCMKIYNFNGYAFIIISRNQKKILAIKCMLIQIKCNTLCSIYIQSILTFLFIIIK